MDKIIYHFNPGTGEFLSSGPVYIGPEGDEQIPAFATVTPPPELVEGHVAVVAPGSSVSDHTCSWLSVRDWRRTALYRTADGTPFRVGDGTSAGWPGLGDLPPELTDLAKPTGFHAWSGSHWELDLRAAKVARLSEIDAACAAKQAAPFKAGASVFAADPISVARTLAAAQIGGLAKATGRGYSCFLRTSEGNEVELDADGVVEVAFALAEHRDACSRICRQLQAEVEKATDEEMLASIVWPPPP